jgi:hypothetical protein
VPAGNDFVAIESYDYCTRAYKKDGSVVVIGLNEYEPRPGVTGRDSDFVSMSSCGYHTVALKTDGTVAGWGYNAYKQCNVPPGAGFVAVAAGGKHSLALKTDASASAQAGLDSYRKLDDNAIVLRTIARNIYYRVGVLGEPLILIMLCLSAFAFYKWPQTAPKFVTDNWNRFCKYLAKIQF